MSDDLNRLMEAGRLPPLCYYFARFVAVRCGEKMDGLLAHSAALVSARNLQGDVCVDLKRFAGRPLFDNETGETNLPVLIGPPIEDWLNNLRTVRWIGKPGTGTPLVLDRCYLYLEKYWQFEQRVAETLLKRMEPVQGLDRERLADGLSRLFPPGTEHGASSTSNETDWQRVAAAIAVGRRFAVISGGPGTGKTTTVVKVLALLLEQNPNLSIAMAAPTGKAAARLTEAVSRGKGRVDAAPDLLELIPEEASTIHRLLGFGGNGFRHHRGNPLILGCLVVDEASMIDLPLMARLLDALPPSTRIILLGDRDQLASVEAGNVLGDITGHGQTLDYSPDQTGFLEQVGAVAPGRLAVSGQSPAVADALGLLHTSHRFGSASGIGELARLVNAGKGREAMELLSTGRFEDIGWRETGPDRLDPRCLDWAIGRYANCLTQQDIGVALTLFEQTRVLAALHQGPFGVETINRLIEDGLRNRGLIGPGTEYQGKPIMVTSNDYEVGLFNGDIGLMWRDDDGALRAFFPGPNGGPRSISIRQLPVHKSAYALTVHKSQGSEFSEVLLVLPYDPSPVLTRELIYTGITRASRRVTLQGRAETFIAGCAARVERSSALAVKLGWGEPPPKQADSDSA